MIRPLPFLQVVLSITLVFAYSMIAQPSSRNHQTAKSFSRTFTVEQKLDYLLHLPKGYDAGRPEGWPLMLFLHGAGERGSDLSLVKKHGPPKLVEQGAEFPFILVSPQCPAGETWDDDTLLGLLDEVMANYHVDPKRVYLTGLSMGGYGTWSLGLKHPERFAAIVPICGGGQTISVKLAGGQRRRDLQNLPVWAFHGGKDPVVPLEESQRMVEALRQIGCTDVKLTVYPNANHDSWTETYANPELFQWFLRHTK